MRPVSWESRLAYLVAPAAEAAEAVRFYETHFCGSEATVMERMKRRTQHRARDAFGLFKSQDDEVRLLSRVWRLLPPTCSNLPCPCQH